MKRLPLRLAAALLLAAPLAPAACDPAVDPGAGGATTTSSTTGGTTTTTLSSSSSSSASSSGAGGEAPLPPTFTVTGVVTDGVGPVEGALVMQGGKKPAFTTAADGKFTLELVNEGGVAVVVAAKVGYRAAGAEFYWLPEGPVELALVYAAPPDNTAYVFATPGQGVPSLDTSTLICGHCHTTYAKDYRSSAHSRSAKNPLVQDLYAGVADRFTDQASCESAGGSFRTGTAPGSVDPKSRCYLGPGVLPDLNPSCGQGQGPSCDDPALPPAAKPKAFGRCADCHAPGIDGKAGGRDLLEARNAAYDGGTHCDVCHHVRDVDLGKPPGVAGALILQRPAETIDPAPGSPRLQVLYGGDPDVPNTFMGGSYQPKFFASEYCGGCHEQKQEAMIPGTSLDPVRWPDGLPTHSTYSEWASSSLHGTPVTCQYCHMPPDDHGLLNSVDTTTVETFNLTNGFKRTPEQMRKHVFLGPLAGSPRLIEGAMSLSISGAATGGGLAVTATLSNDAAGHAIPTGEAMRSLLLVVGADACGSALAPTGGQTLDDWGGAAASFVVGPGGAEVIGNQITLAEASPAAVVSAVVRAVRPSGAYDDYAGTGFFADPTLTAAEKGIEIHLPLGEAVITAASGTTLTLSAPLAVQSGDLLFIGDVLAWPPADGAPSAALAGRPGRSFARTLVDAAGARGAPHYRAVDMVSDNRVRPQGTVTSQHTFALPPGCAQASVTAALIYRPLPLALARQRGWDARDYVVRLATTTVPLP